MLHALAGAARVPPTWSREHLKTASNGWGEEVMSNAVDVLIHGTRSSGRAIRNVRGWAGA